MYLTTLMNHKGIWYPQYPYISGRERLALFLKKHVGSNCQFDPKIIKAFADQFGLEKSSISAVLSELKKEGVVFVRPSFQKGRNKYNWFVA